MCECIRAVVTLALQILRQAGILVVDIRTNMKTLRKQRARPKAGDVFVLQMPDSLYTFGRVIADDARWTLDRDAPLVPLIYIFKMRSTEALDPGAEELVPEDLLLAPIMTNWQPWTRGLFQTLVNRPVRTDERLSQHCFIDVTHGEYRDELGSYLPGPIEPVGDYMLHSFRTIDDAVSEALGFDLVPD
jgi:hypothetical protein